MTWSDGMARSTGSSQLTRCIAASVSAGAVPRPLGSSRIALGFAPARVSCACTMKRWVSLHTRSGSPAAASPAQRITVSCSSVRAPFSACSGFGWYSRDSGHSRVPDPPQRITGWIMVGVTPSSIKALVPSEKRKVLLEPLAAPTLAVEFPVAPLDDKSRQIVRPGAFAHLPHLLGEGLRPGEAPREAARRARLEEKAVPARLDQLESRALVGRDDRKAVGEAVDQLSRQRLIAKLRQHEVGCLLETRLQLLAFQRNELDARAGKERERLAERRAGALAERAEADAARAERLTHRASSAACGTEWWACAAASAPPAAARRPAPPCARWRPSAAPCAGAVASPAVAAAAHPSALRPARAARARAGGRKHRDNRQRWRRHSWCFLPPSHCGIQAALFSSNFQYAPTTPSLRSRRRRASERCSTTPSR